MASIVTRGNSHRLRWRLHGEEQAASFQDAEMAQRAKLWVESERHGVTSDDVYDKYFPKPASEPDVEEGDGTETFAAWAEVYLGSRTKLDPGQKHRYRVQLTNELLPAFGELPLKAITGREVAEFLNDLGGCDCDGPVQGPRCRRARNNEHGLDPRTVDRYYSLLHGILDFAVKEKKIPDNPADRTDWIRGMIAHDDDDDESADHVYLEEWEYARIYQHLDEDARPLIDFLVGTGARWGEATASQVRGIDVFGDMPLFRIHRAWKFDSGKKEWYVGRPKGRRRRTINIGAELKETLIPLVASEHPDALLFPNSKGGRLDHSNFVRRRWAPAVTAAMRCAAHPPLPEGRQFPLTELAGPRCGNNGGMRKGEPCRSYVARGWNRCKDHRLVPRDAVSNCGCPGVLRRRPTLHDLRHTHAAWAILANQPLIAISKRLGHSSIVVTEKVYAGLLPEVSEALVAVIDGFMSRTRHALAVLEAGQRAHESYSADL